MCAYPSWLAVEIWTLAVRRLSRNGIPKTFPVSNKLSLSTVLCGTRAGSEYGQWAAGALTVVLGFAGFHSLDEDPVLPPRL